MTLVGIGINNRTNRAAISAADEREYRKWRREMVLRQGSEALETVLLASDTLSDVLTGYSYSGKTLDDFVDTIYECERKLDAIGATLDMLDAHAVAKACGEIKIQMMDALDPAREVWSLREARKMPIDDRPLETYVGILYRFRDQLSHVVNAELHRQAQSDERTTG
ncbi:hypothetical protein [Nocardia sp. CA-119907]|uniref:hypothetical protein n=1 Tax=Nocardia sp. CA-119907 TaxID=3239973 RepID=UPI003D977198